MVVSFNLLPVQSSASAAGLQDMRQCKPEPRTSASWKSRFLLLPALFLLLFPLVLRWPQASKGELEHGGQGTVSPLGWPGGSEGLNSHLYAPAQLKCQHERRILTHLPHPGSEMASGGSPMPAPCAECGCWGWRSARNGASAELGRRAVIGQVKSQREVLVVRKEKWQLCGSVALDPKDGKWSCCKGFYPFHRPTQRCCQTWGKFIIIPMDPEKSEAEDCRTHTQKTLGVPEQERARTIS
ncbi:uncharacterized protein LOC116665673 isoform X2 [Camelus ferus]|uniref:Uncharacterized protein LOC116665673 isoform X2 n=1 Tax=Camelus ferus TaxID=419612 RepID=A0A8B8TIR2_CAMFR|nr:uncharacterized protein LOC116665673 isoform X2 [Camelus ferus]